MDRGDRTTGDGSAPAPARAPGHGTEPARLSRSRGIPFIWLIPIVAVGIGGWLVWDTLSKQGPTIRITFDSAEGMTADQSQLKYKDLTLGTVKTLRLTPDRSHVVATVATTREASSLLRKDTQFWVVRPRLFAGTLSGLGTLLSGSYIGMKPGLESSPSGSEFTGLEDPPVLETDTPGHQFLVRADRLGAVTIGSPVFFRDLQVGEVLGYDIGDMAANVTIHVFVRAPFDKYVSDNTRFWNASGLSLKLGGQGVDLQIESLRALLLGGVAFDTPDGSQKAAPSTAEHMFPLFASADAARNASYSHKIEFVSYFSGSVRGLSQGADVTFHGLKVGQVLSVDLVYDRAKDTILAPVRFEVEPERFLGIGNRISADTRGQVQRLVDAGLRATMQSANLLTGGMLVSLEMVPDQQPAPVVQQGDSFVMPTSDGGGFSGLEAGAAELLRKVNTIPFDTIGVRLSSMMAGLDHVTNGPELKQSLASLATTLATAQQVLQSVNGGLGPLMKRLPPIAAGLQQTITDSNRLVMNFQEGYGNDTQVHRDLERLLGQLNDAVRSIRSLADLLTRHPEALIKGRPAGVE